MRQTFKDIALSLVVLLVFVGCTVPQSTDQTGERVEGAGLYTDYSEALLVNADEGDVVLFFSAKWCTTCQALKRDLNSNLANIPEDLTILELDYDTERELKQQYGVVLQHTLVQVDSAGNKIKMWNGGNTLQTVIDNVT